LKNYLVKSLHRINRATETFGDSLNPHRPVVVDYNNIIYYEQMQQLSIRSYEKNLQGDWTLLYLSEQFDSLQDSFRYTFEQTYRLWQSEPCNVLYADPDTVCFKPTTIFGEQWSPGCRTNSGLRYFPHGMQDSVWDRALKLFNDWNQDLYDYEQGVYNAMSEGCELPSVQDLVQQAPAVGLPGQNNDNVWRHLDDTKNIIHFHSSRSPLDALLTMQAVSDGL